MDPLDQLAHDTTQRRQLDARRDDLIAQAREAGHTWRSIASAADLTEQATLSAARRARAGRLPSPTNRH